MEEGTARRNHHMTSCHCCETPLPTKGKRAKITIYHNFLGDRAINESTQLLLCADCTQPIARKIARLQTENRTTMDEKVNWEGHSWCDKEEHRTVGPHRARCFTCGMWCYPDASCHCGE